MSKKIERYQEAERIGTCVERDILTALDVAVKTVAKKYEKAVGNDSISKYLYYILMCLQRSRIAYVNGETKFPAFTGLLYTQAEEIFENAILSVQSNRGNRYTRTLFRLMCAETARAVYAQTEKRDSAIATKNIDDTDILSLASDIRTKHIDSIVDDIIQFLDEKTDSLTAQIFLYRVDGVSVRVVSDMLMIPKSSVQRRYEKAIRIIRESPAIISALVLSSMKTEEQEIHISCGSAPFKNY